MQSNTKISMDKQYRTIEGKPVRILCVDGPESFFPVVGIIEDRLETWTSYGEFHTCQPPSIHNLVEVSPWDGFKIDDPVMVRDHETENWVKRYFAGVTSSGHPLTWMNGNTSWTALNDRDCVGWTYCRKPTPEELQPKS